MTNLPLLKVVNKTNRKIPPERAKPKKGLSIPTHLTASLTIKKRQNSECQVFIKESFGEKTTKVPNPKGRPKGQIIQKGLTSRGKRVIRVVSDCYNQLVQDDNFRDNYDVMGYYEGTSCRFITLTFRNIIPSDKEAKKLLDNFFKRLNRLFNRNIHYVWVAERQKRGAIHFHILTPENIVGQLVDGDKDQSSHERRMLENTWINRSWNEVVMNWCRKNDRITEDDFIKWKSEYNLSENYYKSKIKHQLGLRATSPRRPSKSQYLLLPNCIHVLKAGNYMRKYMSKEGQNIVGGMYGCSKSSRDFMTSEIKCSKDFGIIPLANEAVHYMEKRAKEDNIFVFVSRLDFNGSLTLWCPEYSKVMQWYFEYMDLQQIKKNKQKKKREKKLALI